MLGAGVLIVCGFWPPEVVAKVVDHRRAGPPAFFLPQPGLEAEGIAQCDVAGRWRWNPGGRWAPWSQRS